MTNVAWLLSGLLGLWLGTQLTISSSFRLAELCRISPFLIGFTLLAIGTDIPELAVAIMGALENLKGDNVSGIIVGNAIGSAITQISLVLGLAAAPVALTMERTLALKNSLAVISSIGAFMLVSADGILSKFEGGLLILVFLLIFLVFFQKKHERSEASRPSLFQILGNLLCVSLGIAVITFCSEWVILGAKSLATNWGLRQSLIGALILGPGTSLPELALSLGAVLKGAQTMSIGNILGSNVFDVLIPVGIAAIISELTIESNLILFDTVYLSLISALVLGLLMSSGGIQKTHGRGLIASYFVYAWLKIIGF